MAEILPRLDLVKSQIKVMKQLVPTTLQGFEAEDEATLQLEYPQAIIQMPQELDTVLYKFVPVSTFSTRIDLYFTRDESGTLMNTIDKATKMLEALQLSKYPCLYVRGSMSAPSPVADNTTSTKLWHAYIELNYQIQTK